MCEADINSFIREDKKSEFPVFSKVECENGDETHPLFTYLKHKAPLGLAEVVLGRGLKWNFEKFLCDENGVPIKRYNPIQYPLSFEEDIRKALNLK